MVGELTPVVYRRFYGFAVLQKLHLQCGTTYALDSVLFAYVLTLTPRSILNADPAGSRGAH